MKKWEFSTGFNVLIISALYNIHIIVPTVDKSPIIWYGMLYKDSFAVFFEC